MTVPRPVITFRGILRTRSIPRTISWGMGLAFVTAAVSGVAVWLNAYAVKQVPDAAVYTTLKNSMAAVVLMSILVASGGAAEARRLNPRQWAWLSIIGLVGGAIAFLLFFTGLALITAPGAAFIQKTLFVWVALLAVPLLGERLGWTQIAAIAVLLMGQLWLAPPKLDGAAWGAGETMIAAATLLWGVEVILVKRLLNQGVAPLFVGVARLGIGVVFLFGFLALNGSLAAIASLSAAAWGWVMLTGLVLAAYVGTWFAALHRAPASAVTSVLVVGAVITAALQSISNGVVPQFNVIAGGLALAAATALVAVATMRTRRASGSAPVG